MVTTASSAQMVMPSSVEKPSAVHLYNHNMNKVDIADQYCVSNPFTRKTLKWCQKIFFSLLDLCITHSYALYREQELKPKPHLAYWRLLVQSLAVRFLSTAPPRHQVGRPHKRSHHECGDPERLNGRLHFMDKREQRRCAVCGSSGSAQCHRTIYFCKMCPEQPSLCPTTCLECYHTRLNYTL